MGQRSFGRRIRGKRIDGSRRNGSRRRYDPSTIGERILGFFRRSIIGGELGDSRRPVLDSRCLRGFRHGFGSGGAGGEQRRRQE